MLKPCRGKQRGTQQPQCGDNCENINCEIGSLNPRGVAFSTASSEGNRSADGNCCSKLHSTLQTRRCKSVRNEVV